MNNIEKKLDALINALGFDLIEEPVFMANPDGTDKVHIRTDIKLTKRDEPTVDNKSWIGQGPANKPPIGIPPKSIHDGAREEEIISAMIRYLKAKKVIPVSWLTELYELQGARQ
jgi:hypothetical protein